jgi:magnesium chelatase family protein
LPPLSDAQRDELTAVYKAGRLLNPERDEERFDYPDPPFRAPHHTVSTAGLVGRLRWPGEIGLARHGVLFLDDLPEFAGMAIDRLRGALDDAPVILVASSNPCPCGWHGHSERECSCSPSVLGLFGRRLDRYCAALGIATRVPMPPRQALTDADRCPPSAAYRLRLMRAAKEVPCASGSN